MAINGITFDRMRVTTKSDALLYYSMLDNNDRIIKGYKNELNVSATGLSVFVSTGACVVQGRLIDIDEEELVSVSANDTGYICLVIDLTQVNTSEGEAGTPGYTPVNNQVRLEVVKELVQQDLFEEGKLYTFPLAIFTSTGTTVTLSKIEYDMSGIGFKKFGDGTMIQWRTTVMETGCTIARGSYFVAPVHQWLFPISFVGVPVVTSSVVGGLDQGFAVSGNNQINAVQCTFSVGSHTSDPNKKAVVSQVAIGRWK